MKVANRSTLREASTRQGFTLVELLVVIAIILALVSLVVAASVKIMGTQQTKNTETNLQKLADFLDMHWKAVVAKANRETIPANVVGMAGSDGRAGRRARVIWIKLRLKQEFPQTFVEAERPYADANGNLVARGITASDLPPRQDYVNALGDYGSWFPGSPLPSAWTPWNQQGGGESAACLFLALNQSRSGIATSLDNLLSSAEFLPGQIPTSDPKRQRPLVKEIGDSWGNNLAFCRWPYGDPGLNPRWLATMGQEGDELAPPWRDPEDPEGLLSDPAWFGSRGYNAFAAICHPTGLGAKKSYQLRPVIVSAGPDKEFGFQQCPNQPGNPFTTLYQGYPPNTKAYDNIYSYRIRLGGTSN